MVADFGTYRITQGMGMGDLDRDDRDEAVDLPPEGDETAGEVVDGMTVTVNDDGTVEIAPYRPPGRPNRDDDGFYANLAEAGSDAAFSVVVEEILQGIEADLRSRSIYVGNYTEGLKLLGLRIDRPPSAGKASLSTVTYPGLLEAVVKFQSNALPEFLPADGPCRVTIHGDDTKELEDKARALEEDFNHYLTTVAREYYPDMDRGLFLLGYGGNLFKKVYTCPVRRRPVSETVAVEDMIVSEDATNFDTAIRVTHRSQMTPAMLRRMQHVGAYLMIDLGLPQDPMDPITQAERDAIGIHPASARPEDQPYTVYETYYDVDLSRYGLVEKGAPEGLPLPYVFTIEKDSRRLLALRRAWRPDDPSFNRRQRFVHYALVPAFGFLALGFLHLTGNHVQAMTAAWRIICDAGFRANFPGGVKVKGTRTGTVELNPGPGEWPEIDIGGMDDIRKAMMQMPYKDAGPVFIQFIEIIDKEIKRLTGTVELEVGGGRTNVPVGTVMSMIEQQTQTMAAVHKRMHRAQARELQLLKDEFADNPDTLRFLAGNSGRDWAELIDEFQALPLVPKSDPNVPAQVHRIMQSQVLAMRADAHPDRYDGTAVEQRVLSNIGIGDHETFLRDPAQQQQPPDPAVMVETIKAQAAQMKAVTEREDSQRKALTEALEAKQENRKMQADMMDRAAERQSRERIAAMREKTARLRLRGDLAQAAAKSGMERAAFLRDDERDRADRADRFRAEQQREQ